MDLKIFSKSILLCLSLLASVSCFCQWNHDFSTNDLSVWQGDVDQFIINDSEQLQLNAPAAGESYIYRPSSITFDTVSFSIYHLLDFSPSDNNNSRIYLALNGEDPTTASGYFIEIGENGSEDALKFYYLDNGLEIFIASATMGAVAVEPAVVRIDIDIYPDGFWSIKTNYSGDDFTSLELEFVDDQFSFKNSQFFGLNCKYSASRADKFFYDDISLQKLERDTKPPEVVAVEPINDNELLVTFSEPIVDSDGTNNSNYSLNNGIGSPDQISKVGSLGNQYQLEFSSMFDAGVVNILSVSGISDLNENLIVNQDFEFLFAGQPQTGDLFISEILFDPYSGGEDFVEIYNGSNKNLDLIGIEIRNDQKDESKLINTSLIIPADSYLALSEDVDFLFQEYKPESGALIEFQEIPAFNNDAGNIMLISSLGIVLDSFDYSENQHFELLDDTEGVSLERVSFEVESSSERNWQSAAKNARFATPGYKNSNAVPSFSGEENFELVSESFSPNQDGEDDQMILSYNLEKSGYLANITVHDAAGFKIKELSNNELLGIQGIITWDGTGNDSQVSDLGIYIIVGNIFHPDGEILNFKLTTVLADFID